jgi:hypothetical protein
LIALKLAAATPLNYRPIFALTRAKLFVQRIPVQIPAEASAGQLMITVGDGAALQESSAAKSFVP